MQKFEKNICLMVKTFISILHHFDALKVQQLQLPVNSYLI